MKIINKLHSCKTRAMWTEGYLLFHKDSPLHTLVAVEIIEPM